MSLPRTFTHKTWTIYYDNGSTFSNEDGEPKDAPCTGVLAVIYYDPDGQRKIRSGVDYYWWEDDPLSEVGENQWYSGDIAGLHQYMFRPGLKIVKFGVTVSDLTWRKRLDNIINDLPRELGAYKIEASR